MRTLEAKGRPGRVTRAGVRRRPVAPLAHAGIRQLTGLDLFVGHRVAERPGPSDPSLYVTRNGEIRILGTGPYFLEYPSWDAFLSGAPPEWRKLALCHPDGSPIRGHGAAWDVSIHRWPDGREVLYAGAMTPTGRRAEARWPEDNWNRRIYAFLPEGERWVRHATPLFGNPARDGWLGHSYGSHLMPDDHHNLWVFYERVSELRRLGTGDPFPKKTELFARRMATPTRADGEELKLFELGDPPYRATRRTIGGFLVEGPRAARVRIDGEDFFLVGFSAGDFPTDAYSMNVAWSRALEGPYQPLLTPCGSDLLDLGLSLKEALPLSWGPARPFFFPDPTGAWWVLFHAVDKRVLPDEDYRRWPERLHHFHRNLYLAPVRMTRGAGGAPVLHIGN